MLSHVVVKQEVEALHNSYLKLYCFMCCLLNCHIKQMQFCGAVRKLG